jgi:hypothetical protein
MLTDNARSLLKWLSSNLFFQYLKGWFLRSAVILDIAQPFNLKFLLVDEGSEVRTFKVYKIEKLFVCVVLGIELQGLHLEPLH